MGDLKIFSITVSTSGEGTGDQQILYFRSRSAQNNMLQGYAQRLCSSTEWQLAMDILLQQSILSWPMTQALDQMAMTRQE